MKQLHPRAFWFFIFTRITFPGFIDARLSLKLVGFLVLSLMILLSSNLRIGDKIDDIGLFAVLGITIIILIILSLIWTYLFYRSYKYELTEDGFHRELGVLLKQYANIPYKHIQSVDIQRGLFLRLFNLAKLRIQIAGTNETSKESGLYDETSKEENHLYLEGISLQEADRLKDELIKRVSQSKNQGVT